jgi:chromosome segregation ATPase
MNAEEALTRVQTELRTTWRNLENERDANAKLLYDNRRLRVAKDHLESEVVQLNDRLDGIDSELSEAYRRLKESGHDYQVLNKEALKLEAERDELRKSRGRWQQNASRMVQERDNWSERAEALQSKVDELEACNAQLNSDRDRLREQRDHWQDRAIALEERLNQETDTGLRSKIAELEAHNALLREARDRFVARANAALEQVSGLEDEAASLASQLAAQAAANAQLREERDAVQRSARKATLREAADLAEEMQSADGVDPYLWGYGTVKVIKELRRLADEA